MKFKQFLGQNTLSDNLSVKTKIIEENIVKVYEL